MKITFYGAAQTTTGSMHLVEACGKRMLLDCGLYQGHRKEAFEKNRNMPVDPRTIDYVFLSHAHVDHSGNLPQLVRHGFRGRVFARQSTVDLVDVLLRDSCFLQKRDLEYINKKRRAQGKNLFEPLYEESDIDALMQLMRPVHLHTPTEICPGVSLTFHNAGHILGSAITQLDVGGGVSQRHRLVFSGDLGQPNQPILRHYEYPKGADILIIESTYADRTHPSAEDVEGRLKGYIDDIIQQKSKLIIPAFSVGRTQQILYYLNRLLAEGVNPLTFPGLKFVETPAQSMALNELRGPMIIIAASGMCEGGRVTHHLKQCVSDPRNIILIVGFQAEHTLGRKLVECRSPVKILGEELKLEARVQTINALSAHADKNGLMDWFDGVKSDVRQVFAVHGEPEKVSAMVELAKEHGVFNAVAPEPGQTFVI